MQPLLYTYPRVTMLAFLVFLPFVLIASRIACLMVPAVLHSVLASVAQSVAGR